MTNYYNANSASKWRDLENIPYGLKDFQRWYSPGQAANNRRPGDLDLFLISADGERTLMVEIKPVGVKVPVGQEIFLKCYSETPGATAMVLFDPEPERTTPYSVTTMLAVQTWTNGVKQPIRHSSIKMINNTIANWSGGDREGATTPTGHAQEVKGLGLLKLWLEPTTAHIVAVDVIFHTLKGNRFLLINLTDASDADLRAIPKSANVKAIKIKDRWAAGDSRSQISQSEVLEMEVHTVGESKAHNLTIKELNALLTEWMDRKG